MFALFGNTKGKEEALEALLLAPGENARSSEQAKKAIAYCQLCIAEYERWSKQSQRRWVLWQGIVVFGSVLVTLLAGVISISQAWDSIAWIIRSVLAASVAIAAGLLSSFTFRENAIRYEVAATDLWNELARFLTSAAPYNTGEVEDTSAFLNKVCLLVGAEVRHWGVLARASPPAPPPPLTPEPPPAH